MTLSGQRILLIIGGGIAAYKSLELIREIKKRGGAVRAILTKAGAEFVTPLSVASLAGEKVFSDLFSLTDEAEMGHIELSRAADLVVVAPATAGGERCREREHGQRGGDGAAHAVPPVLGAAASLPEDPAGRGQVRSAGGLGGYRRGDAGEQSRR